MKTLLEKVGPKLSNEEAVLCLWNVAKSYEHTQKKGYIHTGLKTTNVLYNQIEKEKYVFKIGDFGLTRLYL